MEPSAGASTSQVSWLDFKPEEYDDLLAAKVTRTRELFAHHLSQSTPFEVNPSAPAHFRERARFAIARFPPVDGPLRYALFDGGSPSVAVDQFPIASLHINRQMPPLLAAVNREAALGDRLAAVHFLGTTTGEMLVSLIYAGAPLPPGWHEAAQCLHEELNALESSEATSATGSDQVAGILRVSVLGRCKGDCVVVGRDYVEERIPLADGRRLTYRQVEGSFSNPSAAMCSATLDFLCKCATAAAADVAAREVASNEANALRLPNLLELYCGNGNHTCALGSHFARVLAVEIDRKLCDAAELNLRSNGVDNASVLCASSGKFCKRLLRKIRQAKSQPLPTLEPAAECTSGVTAEGTTAVASESAEAIWMREAVERTDVVLVDPPRCGLDAETRQLVSLYDHILYVSCNPSALLTDLEAIGSDFVVERLAIFDHFAYSHHLEVGVHLRRASAKLAVT